MHGKKNYSKGRLISFIIGLAVAGVFLFSLLVTATNPILAKSEAGVKKVSNTSTRPNVLSDVVMEQSTTKAERNDNVVNRLKPVENEKGLKVTPKVLMLKQNEAFPDLSSEAGRAKLFSNSVLPHPEYGAVYAYVNRDGSPMNPNSETVGFQTIYVEITENYNLTSIRVPVSVTVTDLGTSLLLNHQVALQITHTDGKIILYPNEIANKTNEQLQQLVKEKSGVHSWKLEDGTPVPVDTIKTTIVTTSVGIYKAEFEVTVGTGEEKQKASVQKEVVVFGADSQAFVSVAQNATLSLGSNPTNLFTKFQTINNTIASNATYQFVDENGEIVKKFDTGTVGFHWVYVKITEKTNKQITTTIKVPITIVSDNQTVIVDSKVGISFNDSASVRESEIKGKTDQQIVQVLEQKLAPKAWELSSGRKINVRMTKSALGNASKGTKKVTLTAYLGEQNISYTRNVLIFPDGVFEEDDMEEWEDIPLGSVRGTLTNPLNESKIGFANRNLSINGMKSDNGFIALDKFGSGYLPFSRKVSSIPIVNGKIIYGVSYNSDYGIGSDNVGNTFITSKYFLRKDDKIKQILFDETNEILYVYNLSLNRNFNFKVRLDMYNLSDTIKTFALLENMPMSYSSNPFTNNEVFALARNSGFYQQKDEGGHRLAIRLKDSKGKWLSDYTKYMVGDLSGARNSNYFGDDFRKAGLENSDYKAGDIVSSGTKVYPNYQLGAPTKKIRPNEALKVGYDLFFGEELPYMQLKAEPEVFNVYPDYTKDFETNYKLSKIPTVNDHGTIYVTYYNEKEITVPFTSNNEREFESRLTIPRTELPEKLNEEPGTIKSYNTSLLAINEGEGQYNGLPSQDYSVDINVYNLGAKPIPQLIQKGADFNKKASEVIQDAVILPEHEASFEYEGEMPDTSIVGGTSVMVRMTDVNQPDKTILIKVPIQVMDEKPPLEGIYLIANDFSSGSDPFQNLTESQINQLILEKSEAIAWELETGSSEGIDLSVESSTIPSNPGFGSYEATLKAVKDSKIVKKTIAITIQPYQKVNVAFIDETGDVLHDKLTFEKTIGTTIDLTRETEVKQAIASILAKNYQIKTKPENETKIPVTSEESTVFYQFNGTLFVQSSPTFLNFGRKTLGIPFIKVEKAKYDKPLIVWDNRKNSGPWNLTATLKKPLTSQEDPSKVLPSAIRYKIDAEETVILSENTTQEIAKRTHETKGQYNVSSEWDKNESGLLLEVPSGEVLQAGGYRATILWQVEQVP
ncbi:MucBP domain-containing protein [Enterococcus caccae]|nr:hypothetical protein [Enterococcus caccae]